MANKTLAGYRELFKRYLQEDPDDSLNQYYPDAQIDGFLNSGQIAIARDLGSTLNFFRKTEPMDATTGEIALPEDFLTAVNITFDGSSTSIAQTWPLQIVDEDRMDQMYPWWRSTQITSPFPQVAVLAERDDGTYVTLYPLLQATVTDGLFLNYVMMPTDMEEDDDESAVMRKFPELQMTLLPFAALRFAIFFEAGEADDQAEKYERLYQMGLRQARMILGTTGQRFWQYGGQF